MKTGKDKLEKMAHTKMIYKINCLDFEVTYVGQIKRQLQTRIKDYIRYRYKKKLQGRYQLCLIIRKYRK